MPVKMKEKDNDKEKEKERDPALPRPKHRHHRPRGSSHRIKKAATPPDTSTTSSSPSTKRRASLPEAKSDRLEPSASPLASKTSLPYPSFSKEHSKEQVGSRENVNVKANYYTPDPTDLEKGKKQDVLEEHRKSATMAPPSPPETTVEEKAKLEKQRDNARSDRKRGVDLQKAAEELRKKLTIKSNSSSEMRGWRSESVKSKEGRRDSAVEEGKSAPSSARNSKPGTPSKPKARHMILEDSGSATSLRKTSSSTQSATSRSDTITESTDSDATSIAPNQPSIQPVSSTRPQVSDEPLTPTMPEPPRSAKRATPAISINGMSKVDSAEESPMPPPPPPPPDVSAPKVDYLLRNGGLLHEIPRSLSTIGQTNLAHPQPSSVPNNLVPFFNPFAHVLEDYMKVIGRNGSIAVATGYRSIARRLLDRLEHVFSRDISSETCNCTICQASMEYLNGATADRGVSWGEILEYVSGRQELPQWPPFFFDDVGLGIGGTENATPMQKLDIDVPEEFRAHYIRQSKKTKEAVDRWLESQPANDTTLPQDFDDETLTFAMLTRLEPDQRPIFKSLLGVLPSRPASAAVSVTPSLAPETDLLPKTGLAIQRLYRLPVVPRDPESAMYLLNNPHLHNILATLAGISDQEWDILISGRFDGFLRSGADDTVPANAAQSVHNSNHTPAPPRGTTPLTRYPSNPSPSHGAPVALDEDTEIATLAEVEREIFLCMEHLEDAFEALHHKAETVRSALRERGAGLAQASFQRRRCGSVSAASTLDARMGTPASLAMTDGNGAESVTGTEDGFGWDMDAESEIAPDDSASNISRARVRRPRRRNERRTPAMVEEEDEDMNGRDVIAGAQDDAERSKEKDKGGSWLGSRLGRRKG